MLFVNGLFNVDGKVLISLANDWDYPSEVYFAEYTESAKTSGKLTQGSEDITDAFREEFGGGGGGSSYAGMTIVSSITAWNQEGRLSTSETSVVLPSPENKLSEKILISIIPEYVGTFTITAPTNYTLIKLPEVGVISSGTSTASSFSFNVIYNTLYRFELEVCNDTLISIRHWSAALTIGGQL